MGRQEIPLWREVAATEPVEPGEVVFVQFRREDVGRFHTD